MNVVITFVCAVVIFVSGFCIGHSLTNERWHHWMAEGWRELGRRTREHGHDPMDVAYVFGGRTSPFGKGESLMDGFERRAG